MKWKPDLIKHRREKASRIRKDARFLICNFLNFGYNVCRKRLEGF